VFHIKKAVGFNDIKEFYEIGVNRLFNS
jgi:serine/threonine protein kinase